MNIRVLVVDDQAMVRQGFAALLGAQPDIDIVGQAEDGAQAVAMAAAEQPDVVLMDVRMPVMDGLEAARRILADPPGRGGQGIHVLMLTTFDVDDYVYDALKLGASGFLLKDALADELVAAVRIVASGDALLAPSVTRRLIEQFAHAAPRQELSRERLEGLTERELEVMTLVGRGFSNHEIAAELFIAQQTVKTHVSKILAKLRLRDRVQMVVLAYDTGLVQPGA
ncbi:DNA-binding NarL/FixJ family response regulator [Arthrobacter silviterrae]|uniref:Response regulator transcription factor n=1 Tax=Arthrobacter silviterrae TaxID=2026658 RepID=A0ABX0DL20_9MICC|nr:response regulator transcription factor [Arthrobacter silviterrae]MDQ0277719.1 DNA-binding NarL/FixJ family response regulator [Arthrobacter silviterrae]NGN84963.1 response regulator transcription factor [Arthrobacter silviterrae]